MLYVWEMAFFSCFRSTNAHSRRVITETRYALMECYKSFIPVHISVMATLKFDVLLKIIAELL
jgi:hypothetical protein